ncbi:MAG: OsmC family protein [Crocinitomicaceae bacterium]
MKYTIHGKSNSDGSAELRAKGSKYAFGIKAEQADLAGPAELLLSAFAACCLKNVERFASILKYTYEEAEIEVSGTRQEKPPMFTKINFTLHIKSTDPNLNPDLLFKNIQKFGTIYNTLNAVCEINGQLKLNDQ